MSAAVKRILLLSLALIISFTLIGCGEEKLTQEGKEFTQEEIDQLITNVATAEFDTAKFEMDMPMTIEVVGGSEPGKMTMVIDGTGVMDNANKEMQMTMNMTMDIPELGEQDMAAEIYFVGDWMYTGMDIPEMGEQWFKTSADQAMWEQQSQIDQQIEFLKSAVKVKSLPDQVVDGTDCYVFEIVPSVEALSEMLSQQASGMGGMDFGQLDMADLFEEMSVKEWIAKDSYLIMKTEVGMRMEVRPSDVDATEADFEKMTMDMDMGMRFYDYNQPVSITLPPEALDAEEMPY